MLTARGRPPGHLAAQAYAQLEAHQTGQGVHPLIRKFEALVHAAHGVVNTAQVQASRTTLEPVQRFCEGVLGDDASARGIEEGEEDLGALEVEVDPELLQTGLGPLVGEQPFDVAPMKYALVMGVEDLEQLLGGLDPDRFPLYVVEDPSRLVVRNTLSRVDKNRCNHIQDNEYGEHDVYAKCESHQRADLGQSIRNIAPGRATRHGFKQSVHASHQ
mmetsp:Transcript_73487/g.198733  ORF Transcript_73487/g.198733 Transcript_73487/m.198733 type:complete len:216 (+) Transcript_73487:235-882(+)